MRPIKKSILKILSAPHLNLKKNYKLYRKIISFFNPPIKSEYKTLDYKMEVEGREIPLRIFYPKESQNVKVLIFFHGGGWVTGDIDSYTNVCRNMANNTEHIVVSVDYRLAPENPFPNGVEDCYYVTKKIFEKPGLLNCKKEDITLIGDSAGGNLAAVVSLMGRDREEFYPKKQILIYPATNYDHSETSPYDSIRENGSDYIMTSERIQDYLDLYVESEEDKLNPYVAPILSKDLKNQPDTLIITAQYDPLRDEGEAYGYKLQKFGSNVEIRRVEDAMHGFFTNLINTQRQSKIYKWINAFLMDRKD
jgi:acetyl esterase